MSKIITGRALESLKRKLEPGVNKNPFETSVVWGQDTSPATPSNPEEDYDPLSAFENYDPLGKDSIKY